MRKLHVEETAYELLMIWTTGVIGYAVLLMILTLTYRSVALELLRKFTPTVGVVSMIILFGIGFFIIKSVLSLWREHKKNVENV